MARLDSLKEYNLNDDEYHMAMMLLFFFKDAPKDYVAVQLGNILSHSHVLDSSGIEDFTRNLYDKAKRHLTSELGKERRKVGTNDAITVSQYSGRDSAASVLLRFRLSHEDYILGKTPNLTEIRNVRYGEIVREPGREYLRFLMEWRESLK